MTRRLNIMHLLWGLDAAGMENGVINVCNRLPSDQFRPVICVLKAGGTAEERVNRKKVDLICVPRFFGNDPSLPLRLAMLLRRRRIDILHTHLWGTLIEGIVAARLAGVPKVIHGEHGKLAERPRQIIAQRWAWRRVDQVLAVSSALGDRMSDLVGFRRDAIQMIPNGVDTERFRPCCRPKSELRQSFGLQPSRFLVGMIARFVGFKNHAGVLHAVAALQQNNVDIDLALAGDGPLREELSELARQLKIEHRVHFLGQLSRVEHFLGALDVLVSNSSHNEGMSNAILEAMASRIPVISTRVAASPELLDNGSAGVLIHPGDGQSLVDALCRLAADSVARNTIADAARHRAVHFYGMSKMVSAYENLYRHTVGCLANEDV